MPRGKYKRQSRKPHPLMAEDIEGNPELDSLRKEIVYLKQRITELESAIVRITLDPPR